MLRVVMLVVLAAAACADTSAPEPAEPVAQLFSAEAVAVDEEIWVIGGVSGPDGSSPPMTSLLPEGWGPNHTVLRYSLSGERTGVYQLPSDMGSVSGAAVMALGQERHLIVTECGTGWGCGKTTTTPIHLQLVAGELVRRPLDLPDAGRADRVGTGYLYPLGVDDTTAWFFQQTSLPTGEPDPWGLGIGQRLVKVDVVSGAGTAVEAPLAPPSADFACLLRDRVMMLQPDLTAGYPVGTTIIELRYGQEEWTEVAAIELPPNTYGGSIHCLPELDQFAVVTTSATAGNEPPGATSEIRTFAAATGEPVGPPAHEPEGGWVVRQVGDTIVAIGWTGPDQPSLLVRAGDGDWVQRELDRPRRPSQILVAGGALYDVEAITTSTRLSAIPEIDAGT